MYSEKTFLKNIFRIRDRGEDVTKDKTFPYYEEDTLEEWFSEKYKDILYVLFTDCHVEWESKELNFYVKSKDYRHYARFKRVSRYLKDLWDDNQQSYWAKANDLDTLDWYVVGFVEEFFRRVFVFFETKMNEKYKVESLPGDRRKVVFASDKIALDLYATTFERKYPQARLLRDCKRSTDNVKAIEENIAKNTWNKELFK